jgi:hypothetical protein
MRFRLIGWEIASHRIRPDNATVSVAGIIAEGKYQS